MSYQGARARPAADESRRAFTVLKVRLGGEGRVTDVLWTEIDTKSNLDVGVPVIVPVADVIDALHDGAAVSAVFAARPGAGPDRALEVIEFTDGTETIGLVASDQDAAHRRAALGDLVGLDD